MESEDSEDRSDGDARLIEMCNRIFPRLTPVYAAVGLLLLLSTPFYGWWVMLPVIVDGAKAALAHRMAQTSKNPQLVYVTDQYTSVVLIGTAIFFAGGASSPFFPFMAAFAGLFPVLFNRRHVRRSFALLVITCAITALGPARPIEYEMFFRLGTLVCLMFALRVFATELMNSDLQYRAASLVDGLTGLANRRSFESELAALNTRFAERPMAAALIVGDIDHFKKVNDEHGHAVGDRVLKDVAHELTRAFRSEDSAYRIGGEEFAFIALGVTPELAEGMADAIRDRITVSYPAGLDISMSFGVAMYHPGESTKKWFRRSDAALFEAKRAGRNRVTMATSTQ